MNISLNLNELTPDTLAAIIANLTQNLAEQTASHRVITRNTIAAAFTQLDSLVGYADAEKMLQDAGADPDVLFECIDPTLIDN